jgi:PTH1 family peptidyl-tRNA hydrolase
MLVDELARQAQTQVKREECRSLVGRTVIENRTAELAKPQTFMNLSGEAVKCLITKPDRSLERLVVISDDLALPLGTIRLRPKGTHGGHNGLRSIIDVLGTTEFIRLRIGILPEHPVTNAKGFVLENFANSESEVVERVLANGAEAIRTVVTDGVDAAMAKHN